MGPGPLSAACSGPDVGAHCLFFRPRRACGPPVWHTLEKIVQVPGVRKLLVQTCCLCGQWVAATNGLRQHLRTIHKDVWVQHESTILHMAKLWSKSAISPCSLCAAVVTEPRQHPKRCTVFAQACLLELLNRPAAATGHDGRAGGRCTGPDALRAPPHPSGDGRNG